MVVTRGCGITWNIHNATKLAQHRSAIKFQTEVAEPG
jgi:hypothetical protein